MQIEPLKEDKCRQLVTAWASINSGSTNPTGLSRMRAILIKAFAPLGATLTEYPCGLHWQKRADCPRKIFLGGHYDTVFDADHSFQHVTDLGKRLQGPGVADMKGGIVVLLSALEQFEATAESTQIGWEVFLSQDEERGSPESTPLLQECAQRCDVGLVFEPCFPDGTLASARKGSAIYHVTACGKSAHVGRDPEKGENAVLKVARFVTGLCELRDLEKGIVINVGRIAGGAPCNMVPDQACAHLNLRVESQEQLDALEAKMEALAGPDLEIERLTYRPPKPFDAAHQTLFAQLSVCADVLGIPLDWRATGGVCDGNTLAAAGLPTIDTLGVQGGNLHTDREYLDVKSLTERSALTLCFLRHYAQGVL